MVGPLDGVELDPGMPGWSASPQAIGTVASAVPWMTQTGMVSSDEARAKS